MLEILSKSCFESSQPHIAAFSFKRSGLEDLGTTLHPVCRHHLKSTYNPKHSHQYPVIIYYTWIWRYECNLISRKESLTSKLGHDLWNDTSFSPHTFQASSVVEHIRLFDETLAKVLCACTSGAGNLVNVSSVCWIRVHFLVCFCKLSSNILILMICGVGNFLWCLVYLSWGLAISLSNIHYSWICHWSSCSCEETAQRTANPQSHTSSGCRGNFKESGNDPS